MTPRPSPVARGPRVANGPVNHQCLSARTRRHHARKATTSEAGSGPWSFPYAVCSRNRRYSGSGVGTGGHRRHHWRGARAVIWRIAVPQSSGWAATAAATPAAFTSDPLVLRGRRKGRRAPASGAPLLIDKRLGITAPGDSLCLQAADAPEADGGGTDQRPVHPQGSRSDARPDREAQPGSIVQLGLGGSKERDPIAEGNRAGDQGEPQVEEIGDRRHRPADQAAGAAPPSPAGPRPPAGRSSPRWRSPTPRPPGTRGRRSGTAVPREQRSRARCGRRCLRHRPAAARRGRCRRRCRLTPPWRDSPPGRRRRPATPRPAPAPWRRCRRRSAAP